MTRPIYNAQDLKDVGGEVEEENRLEAIRSRSLGLEVGHGLANNVNVDDVHKVLHDEGGVGGVMVVVG